jgi:hypothetical protein
MKLRGMGGGAGLPGCTQLHPFPTVKQSWGSLNRWWLGEHVLTLGE